VILEIDRARERVRVTPVPAAERPERRRRR
jgi:hypothetical protein